ncbi:MAG: hypothetical protein HY795_00570 [Desulfovibrio sp.]|nr:hypothetical protein [Desulfovibrio sp.]MBI4958452.1 hypothetical protein [Desulfovibrio sp.]
MKKGCCGKIIVFLVLAALALLSGCSSIGPSRMVQDRTDYVASLTESWKRQILLNIVKVRYVEPMFFMDVGDIVAGYTVETGGTAGFSRSMYDSPTPITDNNNPVFGNFGRLEFGVSGRFTDRPTVTYKPMTGTPFLKGIMYALPLRNILGGLDTGISAQFLFNLGVRSMNGLRNASLTAKGSASAQDEFRKAVELLAQLQLAGALRIRSEPSQSGKEGKLLMSLGGKRSTPEVVAQAGELRVLLDLDPALQEYEVINAPEAQNRGQIALQTYSLMQIMAAVAARVDIPEADIASKRALPKPLEAAGEGVMGAVSVRSGAVKPGDAFAAINFHGHWFWVDDRDLATKRVFSFLMLAFTLMDEKAGSPPLQLTIPVQ